MLPAAPAVTPGRAGETGAVGVVGADENGDLDILCASLGGAGRKGGTPRPLSVDDAAAPMAAVSRPEPDGLAFGSSGIVEIPAGSGVTTVVGVTSSGLRRLNKTLYQTERGSSAYHGRACETTLCFNFRNLDGLNQSKARPFRYGQCGVEDVDHGRRPDNRD